MARAKKTERADARRRARILSADASAAESSTGDSEATETTAPAPSPRGGGLFAGFRRPSAGAAASAAAAAAPATDTAPARATVRPTTPASSGRTAGTAGAMPPRVGVFAAMRGAYRPIHLREDIRLIPALVTGTHAIWIPVAIAVVATIWFRASGNPSEGSLQVLAFGLFVGPQPPIAGAFIAGVLTRQMSYMAGLIVGVVTGLIFIVHLLTGGSIPGYVINTQADRNLWIPYIASFWPVAGLAIGAFAGYYRRFLGLMGPSPRAQKQAAQRRNAKSAPAGRSSQAGRSSGSAKATAKSAARPNTLAKPGSNAKPGSRG